MSTLDLNEIILAGEYAIDNTITVINGPSFIGNATLIVSLPVSAVASDIQQTLFSQDDQGYIRTRDAGIWGSWGLINNGGGGGSGATSLNFTSTNGSLTGNATYNPGTQALNLEAEFTNATPQVVYISPTGNNLTADGSIGAPYESPSAASASILDASVSKPYVITGVGEFHDTNYNPKPFVILDLQGSSYIIDNAVSLDPSWNGADGVAIIKNAGELALSSGLGFDFNASASPNAVVKFLDCNLSQTAVTNINIVGNTSGSTIVIIANFFSYSANTVFNITNCYGGISNGAAGTVSISNTTSATGGNYNLSNLTIINDLNVSTSAAGGFFSFQQTNLNVSGQATYSVSGDGSMIVNSIGVSYSIFSPFILDKGTGAGIIQYSADFINVLPVLQNGAALAPYSLADNTNANYNPINYTPVAVAPMISTSAVNAHLKGIDNALSSSGGTSQYAFMMNQVNALPNGVDNITFDPGTFEASSGITLLGDNQTIQMANNIKGFFTLQLQLTSNITTDTINFVLNVTSGDGTVTPNSLNLINSNYYTSSVSWFVDTTGTTPAEFQVGFNNSAVSGDMDLSSQTSLIFQGL